MNVRMEGADTPQGVATYAQTLMEAAGVGKLRKDAVRAIEAVFSLPATGMKGCMVGSDLVGSAD